MKRFTLYFEFFRRNILKSVALLIIMVGLGVIISDMITRVDYNIQSLNYFVGDGIENSDVVSIYEAFQSNYFQKEEPTSIDGDIETYDSGDFNGVYAELVNTDIYSQIKKMSAVDKVYSYTVEPYAMKYDDTTTSMYFANIDTYNRYSFALSNGCWFSDYDNSSEYPPAVLCGTNFADVNVGDDIEVQYYVSPEKHKIHVIGKIAAPYMTIDFDNDFARSISYTDKVFMLNDQRTVDMFGEQIKRYPTTAIVKYKSGSTFDEIEECRNFYRSFFSEDEVDDSYVNGFPIFTSYSEMMDYSYIYFEENMRNILVDGSFYAGIATVMFIIISVLLIRSRQKEYNIYLILGRTKKQNFIQSLCGILTIVVIAGIICSFYLVFLSNALSNGVMNGDSESCHRYVGLLSYSVLWGYLIIGGLIATVLSYVMLLRKKMTLITLHKQS